MTRVDPSVALAAISVPDLLGLDEITTSRTRIVYFKDAARADETGLRHAFSQLRAIVTIDAVVDDDDTDEIEEDDQRVFHVVTSLVEPYDRCVSANRSLDEEAKRYFQALFVVLREPNLALRIASASLMTLVADDTGRTNNVRYVVVASLPSLFGHTLTLRSIDDTPLREPDITMEAESLIRNLIHYLKRSCASIRLRNAYLYLTQRQ